MPEQLYPDDTRFYLGKLFKTKETEEIFDVSIHWNQIQAQENFLYVAWSYTTLGQRTGFIMISWISSFNSYNIIADDFVFLVENWALTNWRNWDRCHARNTFPVCNLSKNGMTAKAHSEPNQTSATYFLWK